MARSPRRTVRTPRIMAAAYRMMLDQHDRARLAAAAHAGAGCDAGNSVWILLRYAIL